MKLNNIILGEISQTEKTNTVRLQISEVLGVSTHRNRKENAGS
jgi:hypothetical protein